MDKKLFFKGLKEKTLSNAEILQRIEEGDISRSDLAKHTKGLFDSSLQQAVNKVMEKRAFTGLVSKLMQVDGECLEPIKAGIDAKLHSPASIAFFNDDCMKYLIKKTAGSPVKKSPKDVVMTVQQRNTSKTTKEQDLAKLLRLTGAIETKSAMKKLTGRLEKMKIQTKRKSPVKKSRKTPAAPSAFAISKKLKQFEETGEIEPVVKPPTEAAFKKINKAFDKLKAQIKRERENKKKPGRKAKSISPVRSSSSESKRSIKSIRSSRSSSPGLSVYGSDRSLSSNESKGSFKKSPERLGFDAHFAKLADERARNPFTFDGAQSLYVPSNKAYTMRILKRKFLEKPDYSKSLLKKRGVSGSVKKSKKPRQYV